MDENEYLLRDYQRKRIQEVINSGRPYHDITEFIDRAIEIFLLWESEDPKQVMVRMTSLMPFTKEQEIMMNDVMKSNQREKYFGEGARISKEQEMQRKLHNSENDISEFREDLTKSLEYFSANELPFILGDEIKSNPSPILNSFYNRFFPVKLVVSVLGNMIYRDQQTGGTGVSLTNLRVKSFDIAQEISSEMMEFEKNEKMIRNEKISTGLPKISDFDSDIEQKKFQTQKRFKDYFVGKIIRKSSNIRNSEKSSTTFVTGISLNLD